MLPPHTNPLHRIKGLVLGFDFGTKHIGIAVGQTITKTARPLQTIRAHQGTPDWVSLTKIIAAWQPAACVVGIPLNMDGTDQPLSLQAKTFADALHARYTIPVYMIDERLTTRMAREHLFLHGGYKALQEQPIDSIAAQLILQAWLAEQT